MSESEYNSFSSSKLMKQLKINDFQQKKMKHDIPKNLNLKDYKFK